MAALILAFSGTAETEPERIAMALRRREPEFIAQLVAQYHYRLLRYLVHLTSRREQAEDLIQATWLHVLERGGQYNGHSRFEPWLFSIARNLALDDLKHRQRAGASAHAAGHSGEPAAAEDDSPFLRAARSQDAARISTALGALEPIYREALLLRFQEDLSLAEIAQVTGAPVTTISSRIHRGLAQLRSQLEEDAHAI